MLSDCSASSTSSTSTGSGRTRKSACALAWRISCRPGAMTYVAGSGSRQLSSPLTKRNIHQDAAVILLQRRGNGIREAKLAGHAAPRIAQEREAQGMLDREKVVLPRGLWRDANQAGAPFLRTALERSRHASSSVTQYGHQRPRKNLTINGPNASRSVLRTIRFAASGKANAGSLFSHRQDSRLDPGGKKIGDGAFAHGEPLRLHQAPRRWP